MKEAEPGQDDDNQQDESEPDTVEPRIIDTSNVSADDEITAHLSPAALDECFDLQAALGEVDTIFERVLPGSRQVRD